MRREGVATDVLRQHVARGALTDVESVWDTGTHEVLVALTNGAGDPRERALLTLAADIVGPNDGRVTVVRFEDIPDQAPLTEAATTQSASDISFEARVEELASEVGVTVEADEVVSHDTKHASVNFADHHEVKAILTEYKPLRLRSRLLGDPVDWRPTRSL